MKKLIGGVGVAAILASGAIVGSAAPAAATTTTGTFACHGALYSYSINYTRYQGSGGLRSKVTRIALSVEAPNYPTQHESRERVLSSAGTAWDSTYMVSPAVSGGALHIVNFDPATAPNQLVANGARVLLQAGIWNDGYAACDQNVYI